MSNRVGFQNKKALADATVGAFIIPKHGFIVYQNNPRCQEKSACSSHFLVIQLTVIWSKQMVSEAVAVLQKTQTHYIQNHY